VGRQHALRDEAGELRRCSADLTLPAAELLGYALAHAGLRDEGHSRIGRRRVVVHGCGESAAKMRSGVSGRCAKRIPVASATALATAGATGLIGHSPCDLAPSGPMRSWVSAKNTSLGGTSAKAG